MIALVLLLAGCPPTVDPWLGAWTWEDAHLVDNTCPVADDAVAETLGFVPLPVTLTVDGEAGADAGVGTLCGGEGCATEVEGEVALVSDAATWTGTLATGPADCAVAVVLTGVLHRAEPCDAETCGVPGFFLDGELTLEGEGCAAYEAEAQAASGRDEPYAGCDVTWYAQEG